jgi:predicted nucleic acid-binding protein
LPVKAAGDLQNWAERKRICGRYRGVDRQNLTMVLVDTSIWVNHLRRGDIRLENLLLDGEVACHPFVIGELACGNIKNRSEILALLHDLPKAPTIDLAEYLHFIEQNHLSGTGIGFVDVHLLASAQLSGVPLWTKDKRLKETAFKLKVFYI